MASGSFDVELYKLNYRICDDHIFHERSRTHWWRAELGNTERWMRKKVIAAGSFATVHLDEEVTTGQLRAVKELAGEKSDGQKVDLKEELRGFAEVTDCDQLFLRFFGWYEDGLSIFLTMEYLEYGDLGQYLKDFGLEARKHVKEVTTQLLKALVVLHDRRIYHRELCPENILIASLAPLRVKISSFGVSRFKKIGIPRLEYKIQRYVVPELVRLPSRNSSNLGEYIDAEDIWTLGCLIHEILTLEPPFMELKPRYDSFLETFTEREYDIALFIDFCFEKITLPTEVLENSGVSEDDIEFVNLLLVADPGSRLSAPTALNSNWLGAFDITRYQLSTTFHKEYVVHKAVGSSEADEVWKEVDRIGCGGFGSVWLEQEVMGEDFREEGVAPRLRAVKRIPRNSHKMDYKRELSALIEVRDYPDIFVQFFGWYTNDRDIFLAMEYVELGDLSQYLEDSGPQTESIAKDIVRQLLKGLVFLHQRQICHRDLKPQNVLIASSSPIKIKLTDFGISKSTMLTNLRTKIGTQGYMAPELLGMLPRGMSSGGQYTNSVDMWALGCLLHEILTLETPFIYRFSSSTWQSETVTSGTDDTIATDMNLLSEFCKSNVELPTEILHEYKVSRSCIDFLKGLIAVDPRSRMSATEAIRSGWLSGLPENLDEDEVIRNQFLSLGVHLSPRATAELMLQWQRAGDVDAAVLPTSLVKDPRDILYAAASKGYTSIVEILLCLMPTTAGKMDLDFRIQGWTSLQLAAMGGYFDVVKVLLEKKAKVNATPHKDQGRTALQAAAQGGHLEVVRLLLDMKADVNAKPAYDGGLRALQAAAQSGNLEVVKLLLERGANVNAPPSKINGRTALQAAAGHGNIKLVRLLLDRDADVDAEPCEIKGRTALQAAAEHGHFGIVRLLLDKDADINAEACEIEGRTALQAAAEKGHLDVVKLLLEMGADVNAEPSLEEGRTALAAAIHGQHLEVEKELRAAGAELYFD